MRNVRKANLPGAKPRYEQNLIISTFKDITKIQRILNDVNSNVDAE